MQHERPSSESVVSMQPASCLRRASRDSRYARRESTATLISFKSCGTALNEAPSAAARETLPIVAAKLESTAQWWTVPVPPITGPLKVSKTCLIKGAAQYILKNERRDSEKKNKRGHELCQLPTSLAAFTDQFREGKAYLHLKLNLAKSHKQEASPNYTHSVMESRRST